MSRIATTTAASSRSLCNRLTAAAVYSRPAVRFMSKAAPPKKSTDHHFNKDGGWAEETATNAEASVKADRDHHATSKDSLKSLQKKSAELLAKKDGKKAGGH
ncbi:hypothetical protein HDU86_005944 [Geranomyces michiganensis]|nr:hypothetical protein HDU86_005944 [Geranomyces michiganensis]